ncbi:uncharacterized protein LOC121886081 [Thunnus maccoyii]|uniref:uncharacterized protein LOC121886081 n=1 Tax=Thunnus maccoyii TaxID=8240 RepID=UPI001C4B8869|nr:uncharacterized protein LOC121886081 [Thunnus maccoyii]
MEGRSKKRNMAYKREQRRQATRQRRARDSDSEVSALRRALQSAKKTNQKLSSINFNLGKQVEEFKRMEISWVKQKGKLMHDNSCIHKIFETKYNKARNEINRLEEALDAAEADKEQINRKNEKIRESQKEIEALQERLHHQREIINIVQSFWEKDYKQLQTDFENIVNVVKAELDNQWSLKEIQITTELKEIHEKCRMQREEIMIKEKMITGLLRERLDLMNEMLQTAIQMHEKDDAHEQSERQWKIKCEALELVLRKEHAKREESEKEPVSKKMKRLFSFQRKKKAADSDSEDSEDSDDDA